jgi:hypothetical protein
MEITINKILNDITKVPKLGEPGTIVVFDSNAYPILTGDNTRSIIFAAAEIGNGRIFVTSHEDYIEKFLASNNNNNINSNSNQMNSLWLNIKSWLCKDDTQSIIKDRDIENVDDYESVIDIPANTRLIKWIGNVNKTELFIAQLRKLITNGCSLICGVCPWSECLKYYFF